MRTFRFALALLATLFCTVPALSDQGMTSKYHTENVGRIVFSNSEVKFRNERPHQIKTTFRLSETIYGRQYMSRAIRLQPWVMNGRPTTMKGSGSQTHYMVKMFINGQPYRDHWPEFAVHQPLSGDAPFQWTTWQLNLNPSDRSRGRKDEMEAWTRATAKLAPGSYQIRFEIWGQQGQATTAAAVSAGEFTLVVGENEMAGASAFPGDAYQGSDLGSLKSSMKSALVSRGVGQADQIQDISVTSDWREGRYTDSLNRYRKIQGTVLWRDNDGDGLSRFSSYSFIQDRVSGGWSSLRFNRFVNGGPEGSTKAR